MALIDLAEARAWLNLDDDLTEDDVLIEGLLGAVHIAAEKYTFRRIFADQEALDLAMGMNAAGCAPILIDDYIKQAEKLLLAHWYANREAVALNLSEAPMGVRFILDNYVLGGSI